MAGSARLPYPDNTSIVVMPCSGRVEESMILKAFERGADGVMVVGCLEGDCHFISGNLRARARVGRAAAILEQIGIGGERVAMFNLSAGEGTKFARFATEMVEKIRGLGPSKINAIRKRQKEGNPSGNT